jgi:tetraprenyl-beta-curcumene synthase
LDPLPLSARQIWSLCAAAGRELLWGLRKVSRETHDWGRRARAIPDTTLRIDALGSLASKRASTDGAALFWTLCKQRNTGLLCLLVTYETMADFLDSVSERGAHVGMKNGTQLHLALWQALDLGAPISDYYRYHPWRDDGGYLLAMLHACRKGCAQLPSYGCVRPLLIRAATLTQVLGLNHEPDPALRDPALEAWVKLQFDMDHELAWFELTAAASAWLTVLALLALAAGDECDGNRIAEAYAAYLPWISMIGTMLDSYVDAKEDLRNGDHCYLAHYPDVELAVERVSGLVHRAATQASALPGGTRHAVIVACMVAMYLSKDSAQAPEMRADTRRLVDSAGSLAKLLLPVLRLWRIVYAQRAS